jgi:hypothetical protein
MAQIARLRALSEELGSPGALALYTAARKRGLRVTRRDATELVTKQGQRHIFANVQPSAGKTAAESQYARFQADVIDQRNDKGTEGEELAKDILVVVNVFSRQVYARPMSNKSAEQTTKALISILDTIPETPGVLSTDGGLEFSGAFAAELKKRGIAQKLKDGTNAIAVVDRSIQSLKKTLARIMATQEGSWQKLLAQAVKAINNTPKEVLHHEAPADVLDNPEVSFMLLQDNARALRHNAELLKTRTARLEEAGAMRAPLPAKSFKRGHEATYGSIKQLDRIEGSVAVAQDGTRIDVKHLKPVHEDSSEATARFGHKDNSVKVEKQRKDVQVLIALTLAFLQGKERASLSAISAFLKGQLRSSTETFERVLRKVKLTLVNALRLAPGLEITDGRWVKLA